MLADSGGDYDLALGLQTPATLYEFYSQRRGTPPDYRAETG